MKRQNTLETSRSNRSRKSATSTPSVSHMKPSHPVQLVLPGFAVFIAPDATASSEGAAR